MAQAKPGDSVRIHYQGALSDGTVFDSTHDSDPFQFTIGGGMVIPGIDNGVVGMSEGEVKIVSIQPEDAYGEYEDQNLLAVERSQLPDDVTLEIGKSFQLQSEDGRNFNVTILKIDGDKIQLDGNHPLAGNVLTFEITLVEIVKS